jgi:alpha-tubulin suppressor-like RCC1 family protein
MPFLDLGEIMLGRLNTKMRQRAWIWRIGWIVVHFGCGGEVSPLVPMPPEAEAPPAATQVAFRIQPTDGHINVTLDAIEVVVSDTDGGVVASSSAPITIALAANPSGATLSGTTTVNAVNGVATFDDLIIDRSASYRLTVESPTLSGATSSAFDVVFAMRHVSVGFDHSCGVAATGQAYCWGHNNYGQLGASTPASEASVPIEVSGGFGFVTVTSGGGHACGLTAQGVAYCWGNNVTGQLGDGNAPHNRIAPEAVLGGHAFSSVAAAGTHTCGVTTAGDIYCWGYNAEGQLGNAAAGNETDTPVLADGGRSFAAVTVGDAHTCGLATDGAAYCWGSNHIGSLGDGNAAVDSDVPVPVAGGHIFVDVSAGAGHTCGIADTGVTHCWGANYTGQLGNGNLGAESDTPVAVVGNVTFVHLSEGGAENGHTCALTVDGEAYCWGDNSRGQLGDGGAEEETDAPGAVSGGVAFRILSTGGNHSCGLAVNGAVYCWGHNEKGQLGDGQVGENQSVPVRVADPVAPPSL